MSPAGAFARAAARWACGFALAGALAAPRNATELAAAPRVRSSASATSSASTRGDGATRPTRDELLALAWAGARLVEQDCQLSAAELERAAALVGEPLPSARCTRIAAFEGARLLGMAYLDTHRVRTLPETLLVLVEPDGRVRRVELLSFSEPHEYQPRAGFYAQFAGRRLDAELALGRGLHGISGASLSARATTSAVRRALALHALLPAPPAPAPTPAESRPASRPAASATTPVPASR